MERFIHDENIRRYRTLLEREQDEEKRTLIQKLLMEEESKILEAQLRQRGNGE